MARRARGTVAAAFREVTTNEPAVVAKTRRKQGAAAARRQTVAIALAKARRAGARVPYAAEGSGPMTPHELRRGYRRLGA
jgi:hypothetical protein